MIATSTPCARLSGADPALVHATEDWSTDEALAAGLQFAFAGRASALIRAAADGRRRARSPASSKRGAPVRDVCNCAGAESPLWAATVARRPRRSWSTCSTRAPIRTRRRSRARHRSTSPCSAATTTSSPACSRPVPIRIGSTTTAGPRPTGSRSTDPAPLGRAPPVRVRADRYPRRRPLRAVAPRTACSTGRPRSGSVRRSCCSRSRTRCDRPSSGSSGSSTVRTARPAPSSEIARDGSRLPRAARAARVRTHGARRAHFGSALAECLRDHLPEAGCTARRSRARARRDARAARLLARDPNVAHHDRHRAVRRDLSARRGGTTRRLRRAGRLRPCSGRSVRCGPPSIPSRTPEPLVPERAARAARRPRSRDRARRRSRSKAMRRCRRSRSTSRSRSRSRSPSPHGPASAPRTTTMLDEVEALVSGRVAAASCNARSPDGRMRA